MIYGSTVAEVSAALAEGGLIGFVLCSFFTKSTQKQISLFVFMVASGVSVYLFWIFDTRTLLVMTSWFWFILSALVFFWEKGPESSMFEGLEDWDSELS